MRKKWFKNLAFLMVAFLLTGNVPATGLVAAAGKQVSVTLNGRNIKQEVPPLWEGNRILISLSSLKASLGLATAWDPATETVIIDSSKGTLKLVAGNKKMWGNGKELSLDAAPKMVQGRIMVPAGVLKCLGVTVGWNGKTRTVNLSYLMEPKRMISDAFPANVAFTNNGHLWLLDGAQKDAEPVQVTETGNVQISGWSGDGRWLAYLYTDKDDFYGDNAFLWVVDGKNKKRYQVDSQPVLNLPTWSPTSNTLVYATSPTPSWYLHELKLAKIGEERADISTVLKSGPVNDWVWTPTGDGLIISTARVQENPLNIELLSLKGERTVLYNLAGSIGEKEKQEGIYPWGADGLKVSPDGRYLAYFLHPNSGSLSADGVEIQLLDLKEKGEPKSIGSGLINREWLTWAPDSTKLTFIEGCGREATANKRLTILDVETGKITDGGKNGYVDTWPVWVNSSNPAVLFLRGKENLEWLGKVQDRVLVPGEEVWLRTAGGEEKTLTKGTLATAHRTLQVSADGKYLTYLSLESYNQGLLVFKFLDSGKEVEILNGLTGEPGFYGNYYPGWVSVYFK